MNYFNLNTASMLQLCCKYAANMLQKNFLDPTTSSLIFVVQIYVSLPICVPFQAIAEPLSGHLYSKDKKRERIEHVMLPICLPTKYCGKMNFACTASRGNKI